MNENLIKSTLNLNSLICSIALALITIFVVSCKSKISITIGGTSPTSSEASAPSNPTIASSLGLIAAGSSHSCALTSAGVVKCWGNNTFGQLGKGNTIALGDSANEMGVNLTAIDLNGNTITAITAGVYHTYALTSAGAVKCWGDNSSGQLGKGNTVNLGDSANEMGANLTTIDLNGDIVGR